jgi:alpha-D-ribose 1-methylphosphonate 5-triphosphate diphosphatase PhnM
MMASNFTSSGANMSSVPSSLRNKVWPWGIGWVFAAAGVAQVGTMIVVGVWRLVQRRRRSYNNYHDDIDGTDAQQHLIAPEHVIHARLGGERTHRHNIASAA